jgi:hypothetical protein
MISSLNSREVSAASKSITKGTNFAKSNAMSFGNSVEVAKKVVIPEKIDFWNSLNSLTEKMSPKISIVVNRLMDAVDLVRKFVNQLIDVIKQAFGRL